MTGVTNAQRLQRDAGHQHRLQYYAEDEERGRRNAEAAAEGVLHALCVSGGGCQEVLMVLGVGIGCGVMLRMRRGAGKSCGSS